VVGRSYRSGGGPSREGKWSDSIAVGDRDFVEEIKGKLGMRAVGRRVVQRDSFELREPAAAYMVYPGTQLNNRLRWQPCSAKSALPCYELPCA
jgi:hypothetical protein